MQLQSKLPNVGTTIFTVMSTLAAEHQAINLGQGFPDYEMDSNLIALVNRAMQDGHNQYVHMAGYLPLRQAIAQKVLSLYGSAVDPQTEITITPGGTYAIYSAITATIGPGDEVIVFEPAYDSYIPNIEINGGKVIRLPLHFPEYRIDWQQVQQAITPRTRMLVLNTPHNPTGAVLGHEDIEALHKLTEGTQILIMSDEVYEHLIFDGLAHQSMLRYPQLWQRSFVASSFGKVYNCTGWKLGYCMAPAALMQEFRKVHQFNSFSCNSPVQVALSEFLQNTDAYTQLGPALQQKRDYLRHLMADIGWQVMPGHGSYFEMYSYAHLGNMPDKDMAIRLVKEAGVATIPASAFYQDGTDHGVLRFCFAKQKATLETAVERIKAWQG